MSNTSNTLDQEGSLEYCQKFVVIWLCVTIWCFLCMQLVGASHVWLLWDPHSHSDAVSILTADKGPFSRLLVVTSSYASYICVDISFPF